MFWCPCDDRFIDVIMGTMASQRPTIVYSTVYSGANQRKHQSSASLVFVRRIIRWPVNSRHRGPVTGKMLPLDDVIMYQESLGNTGNTDRYWARSIVSNKQYCRKYKYLSGTIWLSGISISRLKIIPLMSWMIHIHIHAFRHTGPRRYMWTYIFRNLFQLPNNIDTLDKYGFVVGCFINLSNLTGSFE